MHTPSVAHIPIALPDDPIAALHDAECRAASLFSAIRSLAHLVVRRDPKAGEMAAAIAAGEVAFPRIPAEHAASWGASVVADGLVESLGESAFAEARFALVDGGEIVVTVTRAGSSPTPVERLAASEAELTSLREEVNSLRALRAEQRRRDADLLDGLLDSAP